MPGELGALTHLGESADWLKDAEDRSVRDHRMAALEVYRLAWHDPTDDKRFSALCDAFARLIEALRHNHLYPDGVVLGEREDGTPRYLAETDTLRTDFERLRDFCVVNRFGIGEVHLLQIVLLLCRMLSETGRRPYDQILAEAAGDVIHLRVPIYRADNLTPFSSEAQGRYHAVRILHCMKRLGLYDDTPVKKLSPQEYAETRALLSSKLRPVAAGHIQKPHRVAYTILDTASAFEAYARSHAANRAPLDERTPEELFVRLRHGLRRLERHTEIGPARRKRMNRLAVAAVVRALAHVDTLLARRMYSFLRRSKTMPSVRHGRMLRLLPNNAERLAFVNFLYTNGGQNPVYYVKRFERHFKGDKLRFVRKEVGFHLERAPKTEETPGEPK